MQTAFDALCEQISPDTPCAVSAVAGKEACLDDQRGENFVEKTPDRNVSTSSATRSARICLRRTEIRYLGASPSKKSVQRLKTKIGDLLVPSNIDPWPEVRDKLNRSLRG